MTSIKDIKVTKKRLNWSKKLLIISLILLAVSSIAKLSIDITRRQRYEDQISVAANKISTVELENALNSVILKSSYRTIRFDSGYFYIKSADRPERQLIINDFLYDARTTTFTIVSTGVDSRNIALFTFRINPSDKKFEATVESVHGGVYNIVYNDTDILEDRDPIFDVLDVNDDGKVDTKIYARLREEVESNAINVDLSKFENLIQSEEEDY